MKHAKPLVISFSLLAFASASAYAGEDKANGAQAGASAQLEAKKDKFSALDDDGDGFVGHMEAAADPDAASKFHELDKNKDLKLSRAEYQAFAAASASKEAGASAGASAKTGQAKGAMQASELIGKKVTNAQGEDLGEIKDIVIDLKGGKVHAAVLEFGATLGMGEELYAFAISQLKAGKGDKVVLNVDKEKLKSADGFAQNEWPEMDDAYWGRIGGHAKASAGATGKDAKKMNLVRASDLIGRNIEDKSGNDVGEIKDVMVSLQSAQLRGIVIDLNDGGQTTVQAKALTQAKGDKVVLNTSVDQQRRQGKNRAGGTASGASSGKEGGR